MQPGHCQHCGSPDRSKQCRYSWYLANREAWIASGADAPCVLDDFESGMRRREKAFARRTLLLTVGLTALAVAAWYLGT